jgi:hypothetical protein
MLQVMTLARGRERRRGISTCVKRRVNDAQPDKGPTLMPPRREPPLCTMVCSPSLSLLGPSSRVVFPSSSAATAVRSVVGGIAVKETVISARSWDCNYGAEHSTRLDVQITSE